MLITVNGKVQDVQEGCDLLAYVRKLGLDEKAIVAELNGFIVDHDSFAKITLHENDTLELLHFVGGG